MGVMSGPSVGRPRGRARGNRQRGLVAKPLLRPIDRKAAFGLGHRNERTRTPLGTTLVEPVADALQRWLLAQRQNVPDGSATAKAIDYTLNRWSALTRYLDDGELPIDNNWVENQIRPIAIGRSNWLFAGSLRAGQRAAAVMS